MRKVVFAIILSGLIITSCNNGKLSFEKHKSGLEYKIVEKGTSGVAVKKGDVISLILSYEKEDGTVIFNSAESERQYLRKVNKPSHSGGSFEDGLTMLNVGDSAIFRINADSFLRYSESYSKIPDGLGLDDYIIVKVRILDVVGKEEFDSLLADGYHESEEKEMEILANYLKNANITTAPKETGLYYIEKLVGAGKQAKAGDQVTVHYTVTLVDGQLIETSLDKKPLTFKLGTNQVIKGWDEGLTYMKEGGKATIITPSKLAYGESGKGSIMPYSTLVFDIELLKVN